MISLRPYQTEAVEGVHKYLRTEQGNPLVVLPTGTGKSICIAKFSQDIVTEWPDTRVVIATHQRELIAQNYSKLITLWPDAPAGVYSAGLNRRDLHQKVLFAGIQSIYQKAVNLQKVDMLVVDEAHTIPRKGTGRWQHFISQLKQINPYMRVVGFSATPYRMDSGALHEGDDAMFHGVAYEALVGDMIRDGYLCEPIPRYMETSLDVSGVHKRGGEFIEAELQRAVNIDSITASAVREIIQHGTNRRSWLLFCAGVDHSTAVCEALRQNGISCAVVTGETPNGERDAILNAYKRGELRAVCNNSVLTTGFDAPATDMVVALRPTQSVGLWVQILGRGMRISPETGKTNCLVLDFARNAERHGPLDEIRARTPGGGGGEAPIRECLKCHAICYAGARKCPDCGNAFPDPEVKIQGKASDAAIMSHQIRPDWLDVSEVCYSRHEKPGKPPSMRVDYICGLKRHSEWICFEHDGTARQKAVSWWNRRTSNRPIPNTVTAAIEAANDNGVRRPMKIAVKKNGKFYEIVGEEF